MIDAFKWSTFIIFDNKIYVHSCFVKIIFNVIAIFIDLKYSLLQYSLNILPTIDNLLFLSVVENRVFILSSKLIIFTFAFLKWYIFLQKFARSVI